MAKTQTDQPVTPSLLDRLIDEYPDRNPRAAGSRTRRFAISSKPFAVIWRTC